MFSPWKFFASGAVMFYIAAGGISILTRDPDLAPAIGGVSAVLGVLAVHRGILVAIRKYRHVVYRPMRFLYIPRMIMAVVLAPLGLAALTVYALDGGGDAQPAIIGAAALAASLLAFLFHYADRDDIAKNGWLPGYGTSLEPLYKLWAPALYNRRHEASTPPYFIDYADQKPLYWRETVMAVITQERWMAITCRWKGEESEYRVLVEHIAMLDSDLCISGPAKRFDKSAGRMDLLPAPATFRVVSLARLRDDRTGRLFRGRKIGDFVLGLAAGAPAPAGAQRRLPTVAEVAQRQRRAEAPVEAKTVPGAVNIPPRREGPPRLPLFVTIPGLPTHDLFHEEEILARIKERSLKLACRSGNRNSEFWFNLSQIKLVDGGLCLFGNADYIDPATGRSRPEPGAVTIRVDSLAYLTVFNPDRTFEGAEIGKFVRGLVEAANRPE